MKLIASNNYELYMTVVSLRRSLGQRSQSVNNGHRNVVIAIHVAPESRTKTCLNIFCRRAKNWLGFQGYWFKSHVTETFSGGDIPIDSSNRRRLLSSFVISASNTRAIVKCRSVCLSVCHTREHAVQGIEIEIPFTPYNIAMFLDSWRQISQSGVSGFTQNECVITVLKRGPPVKSNSLANNLQ